MKNTFISFRICKSSTTREEATEHAQPVEHLVVQRVIIGGVWRRTLNQKGRLGLSILLKQDVGLVKMIRAELLVCAKIQQQTR